MAEPVVIILLTYQRTDVALRTIAAAKKYLHYDDLRWYVADDGSSPEHLSAVLAAAQPDAGWHSVRRGYGGNANAAWLYANTISRLTFWLEDDWELSEPFQLYRYAALLMEREDIGMVRLGYLNAGLRATILAHSDALYLALDHEPVDAWQIAFTGHPSLRHTRYMERYGWYPEGLHPGDTELAYAYRYRIAPSGPVVVWPIDYPAGGLFHHIGSIKTETLL